MKTGKVYFLRRHDGLVKIGFTSKFETRLAALTKSHGPLEILRIINGDRRREVHLHCEFAKWHQFGEWFRDSAELREAVANLSDGSVVALTTSEAKRKWREGEELFVDVAKEKVARLISVRQQRTGGTHKDCIKGIEDDYGIPVSYITRIMAGRMITIGAYPMSLIKQGLLTELTAFRDELLRDLALVEQCEPLPESPYRRRYAKIEAARAVK